MFCEAAAWTGKVRVLTIGPDGELLADEHLSNLVTTAAKTAIADLLRTTGGADVEIRYVAAGTGTTAPAASDTQLAAEVYRKAVTTQAAGTAAGMCETTVYIPPQDANYGIKELGWFAGTAAGTAVNSGLLIGRVLWDHVKTVGESLQIVRVDSFV